MKEICGVKYYSTKEVAEMLGLAYFTVGKFLREGKIQSTKIGRSYAIPYEAIKKYMKGDL